MNHYISINAYRSSTSQGFGNTWKTYRVSKELRKKMLTDGLPVMDCHNSDGSAIWSTIGIRAATPAEIRNLKKEELSCGCEIEAYEVEPSDDYPAGFVVYTK
jgi:hypothetical protein